MPTKTDRILSYLPRTFRPLPKPTALFAVADAYGNELQDAENSLAAIMQSHWVDHADRNAKRIIDLVLIAALYGLAPRDDESVEAFREHLTRYIRTFLDGTVTVQGILRVTAETLGLHIADDYKRIDSWWTRRDEKLVTVEPDAADAAEKIFGFNTAAATGSSAQPARVIGRVDLSAGVILPENAKLQIKIANTGPFEISLSSGKLADIVSAINNASAPVASHNGRYLILATSQSGTTSRFEIQDGDGDAAEALLGLAPRVYHGRAAQGAKVTSTIDLSGKANLSDERYLRLVIDGQHLAEIDCADDNPANTTLDEIRDAINGGLGVNVASHDGHFLALASPIKGAASSIAFQNPAAQNAAARLFGVVNSFYLGQDAQPGRATGKRDLSKGVDLSQLSQIKVKLDGGASLTINCAGADPAKTRLSEITAAINTAIGKQVASHDGRFVTLSSPTAGPASEIIFETSVDNDATEIIFGISPRVFYGANATAARLTGIEDLSAGVDLRAQNVLVLAVDGGALIKIDLRPGVEPLDQIRDTINNAFGGASHDGHLLTLTSPTTGSASRLAIVPHRLMQSRRFVTRAIVTDEAATAVFGFIAREATGTAATNARLIGKADLSRGLDLREQRYLRLVIDGHPPKDIDCAGVRPRATTIDEIVKNLNTQLGSNIASHDGKHLVLTSSTLGRQSRIAFAPPRATDALDQLLGLEPATFRGHEATRVRFVGTVDLSAGIDLPANAAIKVGIDGADPVEIVVGGATPSHKALDAIAPVINVALNGTIAQSDGKHLVLNSAQSGANSRIKFVTPSGPDATPALFGIAPPREYHGVDGAKAIVIGTKDLSGGVNLQTARFLRLAVDGQPPKDVNCAGADPANTPLDQIRDAINAAFGFNLASHDGGHLVLTSQNAGSAAKLELLPHTAGEARAKLFGDVPDEITGEEPLPAVITGDADLLTPVNLRQRHLIRLAVDGDQPIDINVAGAAPEATFLDEIVAAINRVVPNLATATDDDKLRLTSPAAGENSKLSLLPLRYLELIEYPPVAPPVSPTHSVRHGDSWPITNSGVTEVFIEAMIAAPQGAVGPTLVNTTLGWQIRLLTSLQANETARLRRDAKRGLEVRILAADGSSRPVPGAEILVGPLGAQAFVSFARTWHLSRDYGNPATLQLNEPLAPNLVLLRSRQPNPKDYKITVAVVESKLSTATLAPISEDGKAARLAGRLRIKNNVCHLVDANETALVQLRPGPEVDLATYRDRVVAVVGPLHGEQPPLLIVQEIVPLFDVTLQFNAAGGPMAEEYFGVTIGVGSDRADALVRQINLGPQLGKGSRLVKAEELDKATVLKLPRGKSEWRYLDCHSSRFDQAHFDAAHFAGGLCSDRGVFNVSRFSEKPPVEPVAAVFASADPMLDPTVDVIMRYVSHQPGRFMVNLPADLPPRFGGRFNEARFGQSASAPELHAGVVTEPETDAHFINKVINAASNLVEARIVLSVPLGWTPMQMPFRQPQFLTLGTASEPARLYLQEDGVSEFIELKARQPGPWGNAISVSARKAGPAMYDVAIIYAGDRFENAREVVAGQPLETLTGEFLKPMPIGVLQAKAAGIAAQVTRERAFE